MFGIQTPQTQSWPVLVERWRAVEALGSDSLWLPDHLAPPFRPETARRAITTFACDRATDRLSYTSGVQATGTYAAKVAATDG